ncbi:MAG: hypothetical protein H0U42_07570 [Thermoleophilaceae bacterium]|nr:hypothetical protein [Thermoleophilaceae bacterium]
MNAAQRFEFRFDPAYRRAAAIFGVRPSNAWIELDAGRFEARYGPWRVSTPRSNVVRASITGPYAMWKTAGPARLAITDKGLTFASNGDRGVLIDFETPVTGLDRLGLLHHPELTVTVAGPERLLEALN